MKLLAALPAMLFAGILAAAEAYTVESLSEIRESETATMDSQSILVRGAEAGFEVRVEWRDPAQRPDGAPAARVIRYVAKCPDRTIGVAAVTILAPDGRILRRHLIPPGGADFSPVQEGSR